MSELEPQKNPKKEVATRHIPQEIVPVPIAEVRDFVHDAVRGTSLVNPLTQALAGWVFFEPHLRFRTSWIVASAGDHSCRAVANPSKAPTERRRFARSQLRGVLVVGLSVLG
jgi:hypothetical protein